MYNYYSNLSRKDSVTTRIVVRDAYQETYDVCHDIFKEIQEKYYEYMNSDLIDKILDEGRDFTSEIARKKYEIMKEKIGLMR